MRNHQKIPSMNSLLSHRISRSSRKWKLDRHWDRKGCILIRIKSRVWRECRWKHLILIGSLSMTTVRSSSLCCASKRDLTSMFRSQSEYSSISFGHTTNQPSSSKSLSHTWFISWCLSTSVQVLQEIILAREKLISTTQIHTVSCLSTFSVSSVGLSGFINSEENTSKSRQMSRDTSKRSGISLI